MSASTSTDASDPHDLCRFLTEQEGVYVHALREIRDGRKQTHWMWFVFPQVRGLGSSTMAIEYGIASLDEAKAYLDHPVLGARLREIADAALTVVGKSAVEIFGKVDAMKLHSSATLFALASEPGSVFGQLLNRYFHGAGDGHTPRLLGIAEGS